MYSVPDTLENIDKNLTVILFFTAIAWIMGFIQIVEAVRLGARDHVVGQPIGMTTILLAHDGTFFVRYHHWLITIDHWYFNFFWAGMGVAVVIELLLLSQYLRFGPSESTANLSFPTFAGTWLAFQIAAFVLFWWLRTLLGDPLDLIGLVVTQIVSVIFNIPFLLRRGSARGQSKLFAWAAMLGPGSIGLGLFPAISPVFRTTSFASLAAILIAFSLLYLVLLGRFKRAASSPLAENRVPGISSTAMALDQH